MAESKEPYISNRLWTKNFTIILLINFATVIGFYILMTTLPIYVKFLTGQDTLAGFAIGIFLLSAILVRPFAGWVVDSYSRKGIILLGLCVFFICTFSLNLANTLIIVFLLRFIQGFSWGFGNTAITTTVTDIIPKHRLAEGMGFFGLSMSIAMGLAPAFALFIVAKYSFNFVFSIASFTVFIAICLIFLLNFNTKENIKLKKKAFLKAELFEKSALTPSIVVLLSNLGYSSVLSFLALYGAELKIVNIGLFFTVFAVSITFSRVVLGRLADRKGYDIVIIPGLLIMAVTMFILFIARSLPLFVLAGIIFGIGFGAVQPTLQAMAVLNVPANRRGAATGTFFTFFDFGIGLGSIMWGVVAHAIGYSLMYLSAIIPTLLALFFYLLFTRKSRVLKQTGVLEINK